MKSFAVFLVFAIVADIVGAFGMITSKRWVNGDGLGYLALSVSAGVVCSALWYAVLKINVDLGRTYVLWTVSGTIVAILLGRFYFNESMSTVQGIGFVVCLIGTALVAWK